MGLTGLRARAAALGAVLAVGMALGLAPPSSARAHQAPRPDHLSARWVDDAAVPAGGQLIGLITLHPGEVPPGTTRLVWLEVGGAQVAAIPHACRSSATLHVHSSISADGTRLRCELWGHSAAQRTIRFRALADAAGAGPITARATSNTATAVDLPSRAVQGRVEGTDASAPSWRLLSSPDFLNADVANLAHGPSFWQPGRTANSTDQDYRVAIDHVMDDWRSLDPMEVLVAGDLVEGWWGTDATHSGNFGPVDTQAHRVKALDRAASTIYPQYFKRFRDRGLDVRPAVGDHELGDNPWPAHKRALAGSFRRQFAKYVTEKPDGTFRYPDHPLGENALTAYAWRPRPDVQIVTIDVFDITRKHVHLRLDPPQLRWLRGVLKKAQDDGVKWTLVQGHIPILQPVRIEGSSGLHYDPKYAPSLWRMFAKYGVDLYLCGEVHDITATQKDGVTQIAHGGAFQFGFTNYLLLDQIGDHLRLTLRDYRTDWNDPPDGRRLWETRPLGLPKIIKVNPVPFTIGTADLTDTGQLRHRSGILLPYHPGAPGEHPPIYRIRLPSW